MYGNNSLGITWDSEEVLRKDEFLDLPEEERPVEPDEKLGLPDAVAVTLVLSNGDQVGAITEIPGRDLDLLLAVNETAFGMREFRSRIANNREQNVRPRWGGRDAEYREGTRQAFRIGERDRYDARQRALRSGREGIRRGESRLRRRPGDTRTRSSRSGSTRRSSSRRSGASRDRSEL